MNALFPAVASSDNRTRRQDLMSAGGQLISAIKSVAIACLALYITYRIVMGMLFYTKAYLYSAARSGMSVEGQQAVQLLSGLATMLIGLCGLKYSIYSTLDSIGPVWNGMGYLAFAATGR